MTNSAPADTTESRTAALCAWSASRPEGRTRVSSTSDGWKVVKAGGARGWSISRPDGTAADQNVWPSMLAAQLVAFSLGQRG